ncbi:Membrane-bound lytic murein transglycosylase D [hydrothermal vent metagenome]|uniref:Membrane-bound lytic murein transglycosylase D n=1 Tax=hydrothermal vent metagenome TaxID=652676 RepID=A0A3B1C5V7_9ZZZZ
MTIHVEGGRSEKRDFRFQGRFCIGRERRCDGQVKDPHVSRRHLEFLFEAGQWRVRDLGSVNGTYLNGVLIQEAVLPQKARIELGAGGPVLSVQQEYRRAASPDSDETASVEANSLTQIAGHYFGKSSPDTAGEHTMMVRQAFHRIQKQHSKRYFFILVLSALLLITVGGVVFYQKQQIDTMAGIAEDIFYTMKSIEVQMGQVESVVLSRADPTQKKLMIEKRAEFEAMAQRYSDYVSEIGIYDKEELSKEKRLIMRVARIFGECDLNIPDAFVNEVLNYIQKWKSTRRLLAAVKRAESKGYAAPIRKTFLDNHLPPQFFYLALQESDFKERIVGPKTRFGIAKGIWQFIPATAMQYGLQTGPLLEERHYDPKDERFHFNKATKAAARYLKDIYNGEAQASGLLVFASYNWGDNRVRRLIQGMPENPRERNFWQLLKHYKIPQETYDYVFYIFSAAVIGEDPELFGFDFENPLTQFN